MFSMSMKYSMIPYEPVLTAWHGAQIFNHAPMHPERVRRSEQGAFLVPCSLSNYEGGDVITTR